MELRLVEEFIEELVEARYDVVRASDLCHLSFCKLRNLSNNKRLVIVVFCLLLQSRVEVRTVACAASLRNTNAQFSRACDIQATPRD